MNNNLSPTSPKRFIGLFCIVALLLTGGGYWFYRHEVNAIRKVKYNELKAIAGLKTAQIVAWRQEQLADIGLVSTGFVKLYLPQLLETPGNASMQALIAERLRYFAKLQGYENMILAYPDGRLMLSLDSRLKTLGPPERRLIAQAVTSHETVFGDLVRNADSGQIYLDTAAPILDENKQLLAVILQRVDPARQLYPLIQSWPMPSKSAETMLLGKDDSHVIFLNKLRHRPDPPLTFRIPLTDREASPVKVVLGKLTGMIDGNDYRGVPVLADVQPVPDSSWIMVAKVDRDEILAEAGYRGGFILLLVTMAILMTGGMAAYLFNDRRRQLYHELYLGEQKGREALHKASIQWQSTFAAISDGICLLDEKQIILDANQAMLALFNTSAAEIIGRHCWEIVHKSEEPLADCPFTKLMKSHKREEMEFTIADKTFEIIVDPIFASDGSLSGAVHLMRDITSHRNLEAQLHQSQKIEAIGTLAGGVAHDFNNILTAILGHAQIALMSAGEQSPQRHNLEQILAAANRAAALTKSLLAFSRKQVVNLTSVEVNDLLQRFDAFARRLIREDIILKTVCEDCDLTVMADSGQLEQVIMNLVTNARDAMPQGGTLTITSRRVELDEKFITAYGYGNIGPYARISVSDTGEGMDEITRQKIFEPFFTTKEVGKGTGLGLAMVYGIIKKHDGFINVYSEPGKGTTFTIYLPLYEGVALVAALPKQELPLTGGSETILIAEDDEALRSLVESVLASFGYTVIEAVDGEEAVLKFREHRDQIKLVVLDGIMPKMNGKEAYLKIRSIHPGVKAIFISGYAEDIFTRDGIPDKEALFIQKPIMPDELARAVRKVLDEPTIQI